jgi:hypothetical protein
MSWYTEEEKYATIRKAREALAAANATLEGAALSRRSPTELGLLIKDKHDALVAPHASSKVTKALEQQTPPTREAKCEMTNSLREFLVGIVVELRRERRAEIQKAVDPLERELKLLRHEFVILRQDVALAKSLHDLHDEVAEARKQVPKLPAIVADLEADQARLERELDATKDKLGKLRVDQSITDYGVGELRKQMAASAGSSVELEFETQGGRRAKSFSARRERGEGCTRRR